MAEPRGIRRMVRELSPEKARVICHCKALVFIMSEVEQVKLDCKFMGKKVKICST